MIRMMKMDNVDYSDNLMIMIIIKFIGVSKGERGNIDVDEKHRIRETKDLSTDADSSTDTTVGWTKNTQKPEFIENEKKIIQNGKTQKRIEICQN